MKRFFGKPSGVVLLSAFLLTLAGMVAIVPASAYVPTVSHLVAYLDGGGGVTPVDSTHPLPVTGAGGGGIAATVTQGTAAAAAGSWPVLVTDGTNTLGVTAHPVKTDPTGTTTQPVSGTVTANAGSGTFAASLASLPALATGSNTIGKVDQGTGGASAWKVDGSAVTQPVSGTITANAGSGTFAGSFASGAVASGAFAAGSISAGAYVAGSVLASAYADGAITTLGLNADAATSGTGTVNAHVRQTALNTSNIPAVGQALMAASTPVAIASNQSAVPVTATGSGNFTVVQPTAANLNATITGTVAATQSGTFTVQPGNTANTTAWKVDGSAVTQPVSVAATVTTAPAAAASGGATPFFYESTGAANQDAAVVDGSPGTLYTLTAYNTTTSIRYLWLYNVASGATSASTVVYCVVLPGFTTGSGAVVTIPVGMNFATGISLRITTGFPGSSTAAASTGDVFVSAAYK